MTIAEILTNEYYDDSTVEEAVKFTEMSYGKVTELELKKVKETIKKTTGVEWQ